MLLNNKRLYRRKACAHQPDLLVVIAIIALLISILLPSLSRARYLAKVLQLQNSYVQYQHHQDYLSLHLKAQVEGADARLAKVTPLVREDDSKQKNLVSQIAKFLEARAKREKLEISSEEGALNLEQDEDVDKALTELNSFNAEMKIAIDEISPKYKQYLESLMGLNQSMWPRSILCALIGLVVGVIFVKVRAAKEAHCCA